MKIEELVKTPEWLEAAKITKKEFGLDKPKLEKKLMSTQQIDEGGPAYPYWNNKENTEHGMTLRDYFAGQALAGEVTTFQQSNTEGKEEGIAERCYALADAMIRACKQPHERTTN